MFGKSFIYVIFEDGTDIYWARSRVIEYLSSVRGMLPEGVNPVIGPDATGVGWVFEYALVDKTGKHNLAELRSFQDWHLRYALESVKGVSEVAPVGGFVKQYQVDLDPNKLLAYGIPLNEVVNKIRMSNGDVGGKILRHDAPRIIRLPLQRELVLRVNFDTVERPEQSREVPVAEIS